MSSGVTCFLPSSSSASFSSSLPRDKERRRRCLLSLSSPPPPLLTFCPFSSSSSSSKDQFCPSYLSAHYYYYVHNSEVPTVSLFFAKRSGKKLFLCGNFLRLAVLVITLDCIATLSPLSFLVVTHTYSAVYEER